MDAHEIGQLIQRLRRESGMTQRELGNALHVSDRTVSKWERGVGSPDVSLLPALSGVFKVNIESLLNGALDENRADGGNMKRIQFYVCPVCGNIVTATGGAEIVCCSRRLEALKARPADEAHALHIETVEDERYITFTHPMEKGHFLRFLACVSFDRALVVRLYPEQGGEARLPMLRGGKLYLCCSEHGLMVCP